MAQLTLAELTAGAAASDGPVFPPRPPSKLGGVDPLGLRQINFDLMDEVLPGLNNVACHIRPFVVVAWVWRRANRLAQTQDLKIIHPDVLLDFVARIEVIYAWSQLLKDANADLPGRQVLSSLVKKNQYTFGGDAWKTRKGVRRNSTALSAPINYGPGLKMLGWVERHAKYPDVLVPTEAAKPALDAFEARISKHLDHPAFSKFGSVTVTADDARKWSKDWSLDSVTEEEAKVMAKLLFGDEAPECRQLAGELIFAAADHCLSIDPDRLRSTMAGAPSGFVPEDELQATWEDFRRLQVRQLFRLSLEALFYWTLGALEGKPKTIDALVQAFIGDLPAAGREKKAAAWLRGMLSSGDGPTELMERIESATKNPFTNDLAPSVVAAFAFCLAEPPSEETRYERHDRLPLHRARAEAEARGEGTVEDFLRHVFESWILAQHVYWSVGRGLADARAQGKKLLRLRVVLDEGGWTLALGASRGSPPVPTPDRLATVITLAKESKLLGNSRLKA